MSARTGPGLYHCLSGQLQRRTPSACFLGDVLHVPQIVGPRLVCCIVESVSLLWPAHAVPAVLVPTAQQVHIFLNLHPRFPSVALGPQPHCFHVLHSDHPCTSFGRAPLVRNNDNYRVRRTPSDVYGVARCVLRQLCLCFNLKPFQLGGVYDSRPGADVDACVPQPTVAAASVPSIMSLILPRYISDSLRSPSNTGTRFSVL